MGRVPANPHSKGSEFFRTERNIVLKPATGKDVEPCRIWHFVLNVINGSGVCGDMKESDTGRNLQWELRSFADNTLSTEDRLCIFLIHPTDFKFVF